jgi:hypothetical protein
MRVDLTGHVQFPVTATLVIAAPADATPDEIAMLAYELEELVPMWAAPDGSPLFPGSVRGSGEVETSEEEVTATTLAPSPATATPRASWS